MSRIWHGLGWALFVVLAYFILAGILSPWISLPSPGDLGFVPVFTLFSLAHASAVLGGRRALLFFALTVIVSYAVEETGVRTGLVFGRYHYGDILGPKLGHVPVLIPIGWFMMVYPSWVVAQALLRGSEVRGLLGTLAVALFAALAMTGWDMVMDPPMAARGNWIWEDGGAYFGVPLHNFLGWIGNTFVIYLLFDLADRMLKRRDGAPYRFGTVFAALPVVIYTLFSLQYLVPGRQPPLILIAIFTMLMPGLLALTRLILPKANGRSA